MRIAVLSDIHSNAAALKEALNQLAKRNVDHYFFLGDYFGYYPWAAETYDLLKPMKDRAHFILGNHDALVLSDKDPVPMPEYWFVCVQNRSRLSAEAIAWLRGLKAMEKITLDSIQFILCHGTPSDPLNGRFYPDNMESMDWFPRTGSVLLLGHTHYKLCRQTHEGGIVGNPGSIGQPRGRGSSHSFAIISTPALDIELVDFSYEIGAQIKQLEQSGWYPRAVDALKSASGIN
jgi:putative phosphoesterase